MAILRLNRHDLSPVRLHTVKTDKYKTNLIVLKLRAPLDERTVTMRALLAYVLQRATASLPSAKQLRRKLNELYGAQLSAQLAKKGDTHVISFKMEVANEKFLSDSTPLLENALRLLGEIILSPKLVDGHFDPEIVEREKRTLKQRMQSVRDDKMRYATTRLIEEMCKNEPYRLHAYGEEERLNEITPEQLTTYYRQLLADNLIDVFIVGDIDEHDVRGLARDVFRFPKHVGSEQTVHVLSHAASEETEEITETEDIEQGKLNLGYRTNITFGDEDYFPLVVYNGIFGGFPHSKLFMNVREKASLAYYASSRIESHKGLLLVFSGIQSSNYDKAVSIIKEQTEKMRRGEIGGEEFQQTKNMLNHQVLETVDSAAGSVEFFFNGTVAGKSVSVEDWVDAINAVTLEDVVRVANQVKLDTVYFLRGKEGS
ncbi:MAG TPA: pitrilysin family protein [Bacillales bacterium]|nr:pitrilysin family protein [Bacillales bacterium]